MASPATPLPTAEGASPHKGGSFEAGGPGQRGGPGEAGTASRRRSGGGRGGPKRAQHARRSRSGRVRHAEWPKEPPDQPRDEGPAAAAHTFLRRERSDRERAARGAPGGGPGPRGAAPGGRREPAQAERSGGGPQPPQRSASEPGRRPERSSAERCFPRSDILRLRRSLVCRGEGPAPSRGARLRGAKPGSLLDTRTLFRQSRSCDREEWP